MVMPFMPHNRSTWIPTFTTKDPTITNVSVVLKIVYWTFGNTDDLSVTYYAEVNDDTPDQFTGSLSSGSTVNLSQTLSKSPVACTIYATAQASGKYISSVVAYYWES